MPKSTIVQENQWLRFGFFCAFPALAALLICAASSATDANYVWAKNTPGGNDGVTTTSLALDAAGNLYCAGGCAGNTDLDPGPQAHTVEGDVFILKLNKVGAFLWAKSISMGDRSRCYMNLDGESNIILTGDYVSSVDCDPGSGECLFEATDATTTASYLAKLDNNGNFLWAKNFKSADPIQVTALGMDSAGNIITAMSFRNTVDFDPGPDTHNLTAPTAESVCLLKLNSAGDFVWAKAITENKASQNIVNLTVDGDDNILLTGSFSGTADFDPGEETYDLESAGSEDVFVLKLDLDGNFVWAESFGGLNDDKGEYLAVDDEGAAYLTGTFLGTVDFNPGLGVYFRSSMGSEASDIYVVKLDSDGNFLWANSMGGTMAKEVKAIAANDNGEALVTGSCAGTVYLRNGSENYPLSSSGGADAFIFKLAADGNLAWAQNFGAAENDEGCQLAVANIYDVCAAGFFSSTVDFDPGTGVQNLTAGAAQDRFYLKLSEKPDSVYPNATSIVPNVSAPTHAEQVDFLVSFDEPVQNFDAEDDLIIVHRGTAHTAAVISGGPIEYTVSVMGISGEGWFTLAVSTESDVMDLFENLLDSSAISVGVAIDHIGPAVTNVIPSTLGPTNAGQVDFTVSFDERVQNFNAAEDLIIEHTGTQHTGVAVSGGPSSYTVSVTGISGNGSFTLAVNEAGDIVDMAENALASGRVSPAVSIDTRGPTGTLVIEHGAAYTSTESVSAALTADDGGGSGVAEMRFSDDGDTWSAWEPFAAVKALTLPPPDGIKTQYVQYRDAVGNISAEIISDDIFIDTVAPWGTVQINSGATYADNAQVTLSVEADDGEGSGVAEMRFSEGGEIWGAWEAMSATRPWTLPEGDGLKTVYAQYRDRAGHMSQEAIFAGITLDTQPPEGSIQFMNGQTHTDNTSVTLALSAFDEGSGVREMQFSDDSATWTDWEPYAATKAWTLLSGDGEKIVYVQFRDAMLFTSAPVSASITLDTGDPQFTEVIASPGQAAMGRQVTISFTALETLSEDPLVTVNGHPAERNTAKSEYAYSYVVQGEEEDPVGPALIAISGTDLAGNTGTFESAEILIILTPTPHKHAADQNDDKIISLTELLRVIQFFNTGGFQCAANPEASEDGYLPGPGANHDCEAHSSDYNSQNWQISLTELLRLIQFFNTGGYHPSDGTEDGFAPGLAA